MNKSFYENTLTRCNFYGILLPMNSNEEKLKRQVHVSCPECGVGFYVVAGGREEAISMFEIFKSCNCGEGFLVGEEIHETVCADLPTVGA